MAIFPLTPDGVSKKQAELYALPDAALLTQARAIASDLNSWLEANFSLTDSQKAYIGSFPDTVRFHIGAVLGAGVIARSPIPMGDPPPNEYGEARRTKEIVIRPCGETWYYQPITGPGGLEGSLQIEISFRPVD